MSAFPPETLWLPPRAFSPNPRAGNSVFLWTLLSCAVWGAALHGHVPAGQSGREKGRKSKGHPGPRRPCPRTLPATGPSSLFLILWPERSVTIRARVRVPGSLLPPSLPWKHSSATEAGLGAGRREKRAKGNNWGFPHLLQLQEPPLRPVCLQRRLQWELGDRVGFSPLQRSCHPRSPGSLSEP